jgi:hypothetical protein
VCDGKPGLVIGDDLAIDFFDGVEEPREDPVSGRPRRRTPALCRESELPYPHRYADNIIVPFLLLLLRERIAQQGAWRSLVAPPVREIIETYGLYRHI